MAKVMLIKEKREALGLTQRELGTQMGVDCSTVTKWETEVALPKVRQLPLLALILRTNLDGLFTDEAKAILPCENHTTRMGG